MRACLMIEVIFMAAAAVFLTARYFFTKADVRMEAEAQLDRLTYPAREARAGVGDSDDPDYQREAGRFGLELTGAWNVSNYLSKILQTANSAGLDNSFYDCISVAVYTDNVPATEPYVVKHAGNMYICGDILLACYQPSETESIVWDLTKFFTEEDVRELMNRKGSGSDLGLYYAARVDSLYGRETEGGQLIPTKATIVLDYIGMDCYTLVSKDFRNTDELIWKKNNSADPDDEGEAAFAPGVKLIMARQSRALSEVLTDPEKWEELDLNRYYFTKRSFTTNVSRETPDRITKTLESGSGMVVYTDTGSYPLAMEYYVLVDVKAVTWNKLGGTVVFTLLFAQAVALIVMIVSGVMRRKKDEEEQLRNTFISAMAHELKSPVEATRNTAQRLAEGVDPEERARCLEALSRESETMNDLLNRMLTYTRVMDGKVTLREKKTDLQQLVQSVLPAYAEQLTAKRMTVDLPENDAQISCDPDLMRIVIDNFLSNAVLYGEEDSTIRIEANSEGLSVWNRTETLSKQDLKGIWKPMYEREQNGERTVCGIGLAMCAGILRLHGATYGAYNEGDGLKVFFDLSKAKSVFKGRKYAWINLLSMSLGLFTAIIWFIVYSQMGSKHLLAVACMFLISPVLFAEAYAKAEMPDLLRTKAKKKK